MERLEYSVLMSVYHKENPEYLIEAIESMLNQTVPPEQFVIVKDGLLTSELDEIVQKYQKENATVFTVVALDENQGLGIALDEGIKVCRNEIIARMDSDDISVKNRCERQLNIFQKDSKMVIVSGNINEFIDSPDNVVSMRIVPEKQNEIKKQMRTRSAFNHPAVMYKKTEVIRCGGYGKLKRKQDHDLFSRMINMGCKAYNIQDVILLFRADKNNLIRRKSYENCKSYVVAQWNILRRGHCSIVDFIYVVLAQMFFYVAPTKMIEFVTKKYLRKDLMRGDK